MAEAKDSTVEVCYSTDPQSLTIPHPCRLTRKLSWWIHNGNHLLTQSIKHGVQAPWPEGAGPVLSLKIRHMPDCQLTVAQELLQDYLCIGAIQVLSVPLHQSIPDFLHTQGIRHLVPWFIVSKTEGTKIKHRLITDCREINKFLHCPHFKMDHWGQIFPFVRKGMWGCKKKLEDAYFHLPLGRNLRPYLVLQVGNQLYHFLAAPFGLNVLPYLWTQIMKVPLKIWRKKGLLVFVYLDDILLLAHHPQKLCKDLQLVLKTLEEAGLQINYKKSVLSPTRQITHLGFLLNLEKGLLQVPTPKMVMMKKN